VTWELPTPAALWRAIEAYLAAAYDGPPPTPVAERLSSLRDVAEAAFYDCQAFERGDGRYALRLGNRFYPHMKLVVLAVPGGRSLFCADTHDRHFRDLVASPDARFAELMARNEAIAREIEDAWSASGLLTSRAYLYEQLAIWRAAHP
jgi:hypothetical protein